MIFLGLSLVVWFILLPAFVLVTILEEMDRPGWASLMVGSSAAALYFFGGINPLPWVIEHPVLLTLCVLAYILVGAAWGLLFRFAVVEADYYKRKVQEAKQDFCRTRGITGDVIPDNKLAEYAKALDSRNLAAPPTVSAFKGRIFTWMFYWPMSAFWFLIRDPIKSVFRFLYDHLRATAQNIANRIMGSTLDEVKRAREAAVAERLAAERGTFVERMRIQQEHRERDMQPARPLGDAK